MFLGNDGGILGVGGPEIATILLVGYFVLGPSDLYKLTKEVGKFIQNIRTLGTEASKTFESSMETQLELDELRKASRELNDAFSFRRSINIDEETEAFSTTTDERKGAEPIVSSPVAGEEGTKKKRKIRRRKKKVVATEEEQPLVNDIPDLEMPTDNMMSTEDALKEAEEQARLEEEAKLRAERMERLESGMANSEAGNKWFDDMPPAFEDSPAAETAAASTPVMATPDPAAAAAEQGRFAAQMSGNWNDQVLANEDKLSPLAKVMEKLALLEEEKQAADSRLEEEFRLRAELEEKYYREKREVLETAATEVQVEAYADLASEEAAVNATKAEV